MNIFWYQNMVYALCVTLCNYIMVYTGLITAIDLTCKNMFWYYSYIL